MESSLRDLKQKSALRKIPRDEWQETIAQDNLASLQAMQRGELPEYDLSPKYGLEERDLGFNEELGTQIFNDPNYQRAATETASWLPVTGDIQAVTDATELAEGAKRNWRQGEYLNALALGAGAQGLGALAALGGAATITPMLDPAITAAQRGVGSWFKNLADEMASRSVMDDLALAGGVPSRQLTQQADNAGNVLMQEGRQSGALENVARGKQVYDSEVLPPITLSDLDAQGFYSPTRRAAEKIQEKGTGPQLLKQIANMANKGERVQEEMSDIGLDTWLQNQGKITRDEIIDYIDANRTGYDEVVGRPSQLTTVDDILSNIDGVQPDLPKGDFDARHQQWSLEGGENYRENLMTIPQYGRIDVSSLSKAEFDEMGFLGAKMREKGNLPPEEMTRWRELKDRDNQYREAVNSADRGVYQSSHYSQPNIALTTRTQSFKTNDGQNVHLIDELQSDWHDEGRKKGYAGQESPRFLELRDRINNEGVDALNSQEWGEYNRLFNVNKGVGDAVPDAPAKTAWKQQGLRRELTRAIQQGDDYIALTGGVEQAERYGLRKKVESISYLDNNDGTYQVFVKPKGSMSALGQIDGQSMRKVPSKELDKFVGKEIAEKIRNNVATSVSRNSDLEPINTISDVDLEIGTEGKKKLYDKDFLGKLTKDVKRLDPNAKVEVIELNNGKKVWGIKITDTMRGKVKNSGMSLYSAAPVGAVGALGAIGASKENNEGI